MTKARNIADLGSNDVLDTSSSGINVTGSITSSGNLNVNGADVTITANVIHSGDGDTYFGFPSNDTYRVVTAGSEAMRINSSGNVGIGTSSPDSRLVVGDGTGSEAIKINAGSGWADLVLKSGSNNGGSIVWNDGADAGEIFYYHGTGGDYMQFKTNATERMRIDDNGNVGIGTDSPNTELHVYNASSNSDVRVQGGGSSNYVSLYHGTSGYGLWGIGTEPLILATNNNERMRIDSSGNVLVGKTVASTATVGAQIAANGRVEGTVSGAEALRLNRTTSDGAVAVFRKDNNTVGIIGTANSGTDLVIDAVRYTTRTGIRFRDSALFPRKNYSDADASVDLGGSAARFRYLYLSGGVFFGGTGSANYLDDYEEGTWTPTLTSSGGTLTSNIQSANGKYTKIGNVCHISFRLRMTSHSGGSGEYHISGLPFTSVTAGSDHIGVSTAGLENHPIGSTEQLIQVIDNNTTRIRMLRSISSSGWGNYTPSSSMAIYMSFTYPVG